MSIEDPNKYEPSTPEGYAGIHLSIDDPETTFDHEKGILIIRNNPHSARHLVKVGDVVQFSSNIPSTPSEARYGFGKVIKIEKEAGTIEIEIFD